MLLISILETFKLLVKAIHDFYNSYVIKNETNITNIFPIDIYQFVGVEVVSFQHENDDLLFKYVDLFINVRGENHEYK